MLYAFLKRHFRKVGRARNVMPSKKGAAIVQVVGEFNFWLFIAAKVRERYLRRNNKSFLTE